MYLPSEDSILLANCLKDYSGDMALDIGVGSGIITETLCENFKKVVGTELAFEMLNKYKEDVVGNISKDSEKKLENERGFELVCADAASAFRDNIFDLVVSNPPYLPEDYNNEGMKIHDEAIYGGKNGIEVTLKIIKSSLSTLKRGGKLLIIVSSLSNISRLQEFLELLNLTKKKIVEKRLFFETLSVVEIGSKNAE
ncbi:MAG TPA: HemK2/MTQ2 family protein methyltransferase [Nitrososphaeraceae archaeon]|nr:HemK2/MTQ2 family protein methyltransferase [Nitrososphaeraceae archaeon]